jgi:diacylglycerol kinase family enzyme
VVIAPGDDVRELALAEVSAGAEVIGMAGGDGSQGAVAAVASAGDIPFVCVPAGTRNHFAADLGLDRRDVVGALDAFDADEERRIDMASVGGRVYLNTASLGLYARIVQLPRYREMKTQTVAELLPGLLGPGSTPFDLRFIGPGGVAWEGAHVLLVSNNRYEPVNLGGQGARSRMDSGLLGVIAGVFREPEEIVALVASERAGAIQRLPPVSAWSTPTLRVDSGSPVEIALDGEAAVMDPPLFFESLPGTLRVRIHRQPGR